MSDADPQPEGAPKAVTRTADRPMMAIGLKVLSVGFLLSMASLLKASPGFPPGEMVFFRSLFAIIPIFMVLVWRRELVTGLQTDRPLSHVLRGLLGVCAMGFSFFALTQLPLPEAVAIGYTLPLLIVVFSAIFLKETVGIYRWSAVLVGMIGVAVIIAPRLTIFSGGFSNPNGATLGVMAALVAACFGASAQLQVRKLVRTEKSPTIVLYFSVTATIISLLTMPFGWVWPNPTEAAMLIGAGILGGIGQTLMTESYRYAPMSVIAPFEYTSLILSILIGFFIFSEVPTVPMIVGSLIVVASGIFIIFREHRLGLERGKARAVSPKM